MTHTNDSGPPARAALLAWLESTSVTRAEFASSIGVTRQSVQRWLAGSARPDAVRRIRIASVTDGFVPAEQWLSAEELRGLRS